MGSPESSIPNVFEYNGYTVTVVSDKGDLKSPAWSTIDELSGRRIILIADSVPNEIRVPVLEHEVYEIEHGFDHNAAVAVGRKKAEETGTLKQFTAFEKKWGYDETHTTKQQ